MNKYLLYFLSLVFIYACKPASVARKNDSLYKQNNININVNYVVYHESDSASRLYYAIDNSELIYKKNSDDSIYRTELRLSYKLLPSINSKTFLDTGTVFIRDIQGKVVAGRIKGSKTLPIAKGSKLYLLLNLRDINRKASNETEIFINKSTRFGAQNYLLKNADSSIIYLPYITAGKTIVLHNNRLNSNVLSVGYKNYESQLPPPPFSNKTPETFSANFDSTFILPKTMDNWFLLDIKNEGIYFLSADSLSRQGCALYGVEEDFPKVASHRQMIESIRFITSKEEYDKLIQATDQQDAIEKFWIGIGGNKDRARGLIRKYYTRVQEANVKFSSYKEGWKSDRGMIYIIFGPPDYVYEYDDHETWVYNNTLQSAGLKFEFNKVNNPFTDNDFQLQRNAFYDIPWYQAVDAWREGRVYLDN